MTREVWLGSPGTRLSDLTTSTRFWQTPSTVSTFAGAAAPRNTGDNFAARIRAHVIAPVSGNYIFWIASDDDSELLLSPTSSKFPRVKIASVAGWVNPSSWDSKPSQKSAPVTLVAGQRYFIEALHKEGGGSDHLAIAWQVPGGTRQLIPASSLESYTADPDDVDNDDLPDDWEKTYGFTVANGSAALPDQHPSADPDRDGRSNLVEAQTFTDPKRHGGVPGSLLLETWNNVSGTEVESLVHHARFTGNPDISGFVSLAETSSNRADNFGTRMRGYVIAPATGIYTFYLAGDDSCLLNLSTSASQFAKQKIAAVNGWTGGRQWGKYATQTSAPIPLVAGRKYYIEALSKEGPGSDHLAIGWRTPGSPTISVIPGNSLESYAFDLDDADGDDMPITWETLYRLNPAINDATLDPDQDGISNYIEHISGTDPQMRNTFTGGLSAELWAGMSVYSTRALVERSGFYGPSKSITLNASSSTGAQSAPGTYFATRLRGYLVAPVSGDYRFWISGRNGVELYLSTDQSKYRKRRIAEINPDIGGGHGIPYGDSTPWDMFSSQASTTIRLEKGQQYFIETLQAVGHAGNPHVSLAWAPPGGGRVAIPAASLRSYLPEKEDGDDDYLPDMWESQYGLDLSDNGYTDLARQGERGDHDGDGLSNRDEYLIGTNPTDSDTDGDGESDGAEVNGLGSNALVANAITDTFLKEIDLAGFTSSGTTWTMTSGGLLADGFRGEVSWNFTVPTNGNWLLRLDMELMGASYGNEEVPVVVKVDGKLVARRLVRFGLAKLGLLQALSPWLSAGDHRVTVLVDNALARRTVRLVALKIYAPADAAGMLAKDNRIHARRKSTRTSPAFIEGYARDPAGVRVKGVPAAVGTGNGHWFADVPLVDQAEPQSYAVSYEEGWVTQATITWQSTNVMDGGTLTIRQGDTIRAGAWGVDPRMNSVVTLSSGGSTALVGNLTTMLAFPKPGVFTLKGVLQSGATASLTVNVVPPPVFPAAVLDTLAGCTRTLSLPAAQQVAFDGQENICRVTATRSGTSASISIRPLEAQEMSVAARLFSGGPIMAIQRLNVIGVSDALQNDLTSLADSGISGYKLLNSPLTVLNLPPGGRIDVTIFRAGVMFKNGGTRKSISDRDVASGSINLQFLFPLGQSGGYCHTLRVYDRKGVYLGTR